MSPSKKTRNDTALLSYYLGLGKILGLSHLNSNSWVSRCYICFFYKALLCFLVHCDVVWSQYMVEASSSLVVLSILVMTAEATFLMFGLYGVINNGSSWNKFWANLKKIDRCIQTEYSPDIDYWKHIVVSAFCYLVVLPIIILQCKIYDVKPDLPYYISVYYYRFVLDTQIFFLTSITHELCCLLVRRYTYLSNIINSTVNAQMSNSNAALKLKKIKVMFIVIHDASKQINIIFGKFTLWMVFNSSLYILALCSAIMESPKEWLTRVFFVFVTYASLQCIYTIVMIMSYDKVEKSALRLLETCQHLQATAENDFVAKELHGLSICIRNLLPKFSAAGFFDVNQRLIPGFLSAVTAYVIILIQFRTT